MLQRIDTDLNTFIEPAVSVWCIARRIPLSFDTFRSAISVSSESLLSGHGTGKTPPNVGFQPVSAWSIRRFPTLRLLQANRFSPQTDRLQ